MRTNRNGACGGWDVLVVVAAVALGVTAALPAVRWEPLHYDEAITLSFATQPADDIIRSVFVDRGGSVLHFYVERVALDVAGGVEALRVPGVAFFALAVITLWFLARALFGRLEAGLAAAALATAPLAVSLSTFGRMYTLMLLGVLIATSLAERAARVGGRTRWVLAGVATGLLVHVHPIAPLYVLAPLLVSWAVSDVDLSSFARRAWPAAAAGAVVASPYAYALAVLQARFDVGLGSERLATTAGRSVPEESMRVLAPDSSVVAAAVAVAAVAGAVRLASRRRPLAIALSAWVLVPISFFTLVPAETRFYGRYLLAALPAYLLLAIVGFVAAGEAFRRRTLVGAALATALVGSSTIDDLNRLDRLRQLRLVELPDAMPDRSVVFSSTGTPRSGRPPELLDAYVVLERPELLHVDELPAVDPRYDGRVAARGAALVAEFVATEQAARHGAWVFSGPEHRVVVAMRRLSGRTRIVSRRISPTLLLVLSARRERALALVELGIDVRNSWSIRSPSDRMTQLIVEIDRRGLSLQRVGRGRRP